MHCKLHLNERLFLLSIVLKIKAEGRNSNYIKSRQLTIKSHGINPDAADFDMNRLINQIYTHIIKSTKKSLINDLLKRLLELEFKSNHSIKSKCLKWIAKNILPNYKK